MVDAEVNAADAADEPTDLQSDGHGDEGGGANLGRNFLFPVFLRLLAGGDRCLTVSRYSIQTTEDHVG